VPSVCFYFQVHQPLRIKRYRIFDIGKDHEYFNEEGDTNLNNKRVLAKVVEKSYLPANALLKKLLDRYQDFSVSFSLSGILLEQLAAWFPEVIESFQALVKTGRVELLDETYFHSLAFLYSQKEFTEQVRLHRKKIQALFGATPRVFRNTELIYNNDIARTVGAMGYEGILAEGADHILGWRSPNFLYTPKGIEHITLLLKNYKLSDDIAFRFSAREWPEYPLTADKFAHWISMINLDRQNNGELVNLFMDYETFGEHQWQDTGIFRFLEDLPGKILEDPGNDFITPSQAIRRYTPVASLDVPQFMSWADIERDLSAWIGNDMQQDALKKLYSLEKAVLKSKDLELIADWRTLQVSDHFYYMCTKWFSDGDVHKYFNPYESPYDAFIAFMNVLQDVKLRLNDQQLTTNDSRKRYKKVVSRRS